MRPIIGILAEIDDEKNTRVLSSYISAIERSGGAPLLIPYTEDGETLSDTVRICDGIMFSGGADVDPRYYGEEPKPTLGAVKRYRDGLEMRVFREVIKTEKPILAICRGAQLINVALGGTLYQDIPTEYKTATNHSQTEPKFTPSHSVAVEKGTPLYDLIGGERMMANSFHHQAIKRLGEGLCVMARADDGIIEAVYLTGHRYLRAYQWHPERLCDTEAHNRLLFDDFINECKQGEKK